MPYSHYPTILLPVRRNIQDTPYDCGPAALKIILETLGIDVSEKTFMRLALTSASSGTEPPMLSRALKKLGVRHDIYPHGSIALIEQRINELCLCIVNYQAWANGGSTLSKLQNGHYSVIFGLNKTHFFLSDPSKKKTPHAAEWGFRTIKKSLLFKRWKYKPDTRKKVLLLKQRKYNLDKKEENTVFRWLITVPLAQ